MTVTQIELGYIEGVGALDVHLDAEQTVDPGFEAFDQDTVVSDVGDWVVVDGRPRADGIGVWQTTVAGVETFTTSTGLLDPDTLSIGAVARFRPRAGDLAAPAANGQTWYPITGSVGAAVEAFLQNDQDLYGDGMPVIEADYSYPGRRGTVERPAMVFDGAGIAQLFPATTFASATIAMVAVLNPSGDPYYGLFEASQAGLVGTPGEPFVLAYLHGRVDVRQDEVLVATHETMKPAGYPVVLMVALDSATDLGRMLVIDRTRTTREFDVTGLDFVSLAGVVGAVGQGHASAGSTDPYRMFANMDLLELAIWDSALSFPAMESAAAQLALAYGVA